MKQLNKALIFLVGFITSSTLCGQDAFEFNGKFVAPGTKEHFTIEISSPEHQTIIPITVFHGTKKGPVLGITAGVHGYEYAPILAGQQLIKDIDPKSLSGTVLLVQVANVESFSGRSPYLNPLDRKNLNRAFPGDSIGSITERIAHYLTEQIISRSSFFVDMHSGDAPEDLRPYTAYYHSDNKKDISNVGRQMAANMGFDHVIMFDATSSDYLKDEFPSLYCSAEAFKRGIPAMDIECGRLGIIEDQLVEKIVRGLHSLLQHIEMTEGASISTPGTIFIKNRSYISSSQTGIFYPLKSGGDYVQQGMKLGYITDFFGQVIEEVYAESSGIILYILGTPPVNKGETLVAIGAVE